MLKSWCESLQVPDLVIDTVTISRSLTGPKVASDIAAIGRLHRANLLWDKKNSISYRRTHLAFHAFVKKLVPQNGNITSIDALKIIAAFCRCNIGIQLCKKNRFFRRQTLLSRVASERRVNRECFSGFISGVPSQLRPKGELRAWETKRRQLDLPWLANAIEYNTRQSKRHSRKLGEFYLGHTAPRNRPPLCWVTKAKDLTNALGPKQQSNVANFTREILAVPYGADVDLVRIDYSVKVIGGELYRPNSFTGVGQIGFSVKSTSKTWGTTIRATQGTPGVPEAVHPRVTVAPRHREALGTTRGPALFNVAALCSWLGQSHSLSCTQTGSCNPGPCLYEK